MAFAASGLALVRQQIGGKHRLFEYRTTDSLDTVIAANYIANANDYGLVEGDGILYIKSNDDPPSPVALFVKVIDTSYNATLSQAVGLSLGAVNQPVSGTVAVTEERFGSFFALHFTLAAAQIPVTDAAASGSSGSLKLFDFVEGSVQILASRQNYTAFAEGAALTGGAGDAAFVMGLGSVAANAGDAALTGTEVDLAAVTGTITLSGGTATATKHAGAGTIVDGTGTALDVILNWSGSAATIDANSTINVTGTISLIGCIAGDD